MERVCRKKSGGLGKGRNPQAEYKTPWETGKEEKGNNGELETQKTLRKKKRGRHTENKELSNTRGLYQTKGQPQRENRR